MLFHSSGIIKITLHLLFFSGEFWYILEKYDKENKYHIFGLFVDACKISRHHSGTNTLCESYKIIQWSLMKVTNVGFTSSESASQD